MFKSTKIGIIGGTGWMGKIMADALLAHKKIPPTHLWISNHSGINLFTQPIHFTVDTQELVDAVDIVILAVRPAQFLSMQFNAPNQLVISIMAGITLQDIEQKTQAKRVIRAMPNAAIPEGLSYTPWCVNQNIALADQEIAATLFACFGTQEQVANEDQLNFMTALTGASHGWLSYVAASMIDCAIDYGLSASQAERAIRQVMQGVGQLIAHEKPAPHETLKILTSYGGTTITEAGLNSFDQDQLSQIIKRGIDAAYRKTLR
jgi:pyrroline-5-carboxylate reductase